MVFLRIGIETRNQCTPDMTEIDTVADNLVAVIGVTLILIYGIFFLLWREDLVQIASVREGIGNLPFTLGLTDVWEWNLLQPGILLPQQAVFEFLESSCGSNSPFRSRGVLISTSPKLVFSFLLL